MSTKSCPPVPTGTVNVAVHLPPHEFCERLAKVTRWTERTWDEEIVPSRFEGSLNWDSPDEFAVSYLWRSLFSKFDDGKSSDSKRAVAMEKFSAAELLCGDSNTRLSRMVGLPVDLAVTDVERTMCLARRKIRGILGKFSWNHVARGFGFTQGASTRLSRHTSDTAYKYSGTPETTESNAYLACIAISMHPAWKRSLCSEEGPMHLELVHGNRITTVPKDWKKDRVIAIEPDMNMYVQKGFGNLIRERLRRSGINLNSQETNQDLARFGASTGMLATIDLSMASDCVALELVRFLLPGDWCDALEQCRSPTGVLPNGSKHYYRKFSSMGNGATFELESLIFYGLALAVAELHGRDGSFVSVYGDDIIIASALAPDLIEVLNFCGFSVNTEKTFVAGPFRESCGKHYFLENEVTPLYVKSWPDDLLGLFLLHNKFRRWFDRVGSVAGIDRDEFNQFLGWIRSFAPNNWRRPRIPSSFGDGAFIGSFDECVPRTCCTMGTKSRKRDGWEGYIVEVLTEPSRYDDWYESRDGDIVLYHYGTRKRESSSRPPTPVGRLLKGLSILERRESVLGCYPELSFGCAVQQRPRVIQAIVAGLATWE